MSPKLLSAMKKTYLYNGWHLEPHPFLFRCASISWFQVVCKSVIHVFLQLAHLRVFQSYSICFWSSNIFIWPGPKTLSMGFKTIHFFIRNHRYSSAGCILSWLAVSFVPDLDAPQNLGFGNISAPRKRLNCFQVVWWTKLLGGAAQFSWTYDYCQCRHHSWCSVFTFVFGILIIVFALRCSHRMLNVRAASLKGGKMANDRLNLLRMYCNWGSRW